MCGLLALIALGCVLYFWAAAPTDIYRDPAGAMSVIARSGTDDVSFFVVRGPNVNGKSFGNHRALDFLGVHFEVGSDAAIPTQYLSVSLPHAILGLLLAMPVTWWVVVLRRAIIRRRKTMAVGFGVVEESSSGASAVRRGS